METCLKVDNSLKKTKKIMFNQHDSYLSSSFYPSKKVGVNLFVTLPLEPPECALKYIPFILVFWPVCSSPFLEASLVLPRPGFPYHVSKWRLLGNWNFNNYLADRQTGPNKNTSYAMKVGWHSLTQFERRSIAIPPCVRYWSMCHMFRMNPLITHPGECHWLLDTW